MHVPIDNPLARKLALFAPLPEADLRLLDTLVDAPRTLRARQDVVREGETARWVPLVLEGFACRYKILAGGRRHITAYLVPGDLGDLQAGLLYTMDHGIATLGPARVVRLSQEQVETLCARPALARALKWAALVDAGTLREWLVNLGQRDAETRIAHLLCELYARLASIGLAQNGRFRLPATQQDLADTQGLTPIHVNRMLQRLRGKGLITARGREVVLRDLAALHALAGFTPNYLHLPAAGSGPPQHAVGS